MQDVATKIKENYAKDLAVLFSDDNADEQVVRIRMIQDTKGEDEDDLEEDLMLKRLESHILDTLTSTRCTWHRARFPEHQDEAS